MNDMAKWFVVHTYSNYENKVSQEINTLKAKFKDLIFESKIPTRTFEEIKNGKLKVVEKKMFPCYVLVKMVMTDDTWHAVRNIKGVSCFIGVSSLKPKPLSDQEIERLGCNKTEIQVDYEVGDEVKVISGSFVGFIGNVSQINLEKNFAIVTLSIFGRNTPVEVKLSQITINS